MKNRLSWAIVVGLQLASSIGAADGGVEILRDAWGIPHVFAEGEADGFFGLGYAAAEDRLLQMELIRRKAAGRLAEVFGPDWVDADREARIAGHTAYAPRAFARLPERWQEALRAYAAGVNAWRQANPKTVAGRFKPLGIQPEPWTPTDCLLAARGILSLGSPFSAGPIEDYHRFRELVAQVGETEAERQSGLVIDDSAAIVLEADMAKDPEVYGRLKQRPRMPGFNLRPAGGGEEGRKMSHAWAVSGRKSTTGKPILESDPQLPLSSPPFFYEFHLAAGRIDARGLGIPGCPGLFIGWNRRIAWGASALGVDSHVVFLDRLTPDGKGYVFEDKPVPFERRLERIEVKGGQPVIQEVLTSRHGTVFNSLVPSPRDGEAYLLYDAQTMDAGASARMMLEVMDAGNWTEFRSALGYYYSPGLHIVYADVDGNVGYHTMVHRPLTVRSPRRALEGWTGREEIRGRVPFDELPHLLNPESGYVSHANNLPVGSWYPYDLGLATGGTGHTGRSLRLHELLKDDREFSVEDFESIIHRDDVNPIVAILLPMARKVVEEDKVSDAAVLEMLESVKGWDLRDGSADRFPAARGLGNTLTPYRGSGLNGLYGAGSGGVINLARQIGKRFAADGTTPTNRLVRAYLVNWLRASAGGGGRGRGGPNASDEWTARMAQGRPAARDAARTIPIPYQRTIPLNLPVVDPSLDIVSPPLTCLDTGTIWSQPGNIYSQIVDLSDVDNSRSMCAPGNAEEGSFRTNQVDLWVRGATHPAPLSRAKIEALGAKTEKLTALAYSDSLSSPPRTVNEAGGDARFIPAIPPVPLQPAASNQEPAPMPGRKPDDPTLEAAFRVILRQGTPPEEVDAKLTECRDYVRGNAGLTEQLRNAALLGEYLIEESAAGRLKVPYGSPQVLEKLKAILSGLGRATRPASNAAPSRPGGRANGSAVPDKAALMARFENPKDFLPPSGAGGTEWDAQYRCLIQTDETAVSKGLPTHAESTKAILADAAKGSANLERHLGWVLHLKHSSQPYRPDSATTALRQLYEDLVNVKLGSGPTEQAGGLAVPGVTIHRDIPYGKTHPEIQKLDAYLVKSSQPAPVAIEIHGGGWRRGSKSQFVYPGDLVGAILAAGISVVSIDYRLTPQHPMPAQMEDVARAVQFVRSKAREWNLDPDRIAAFGGSAGAHLAAWVALHDDLARPQSEDPIERCSSRLRCFVALSGPMDLTRVRPTQLAQQPLRGQDFANAFTAAFGCTAEQYEQDPAVRQRIRDASPVFLATRDDPPAFVLATWSEDLAVLRDPPVPAVINDPHSAWHSVLLAEALVKAGGTVVHRIGPEVGKDPQADIGAILSFLRQQLLSSPIARDVSDMQVREPVLAAAGDGAAAAFGASDRVLVGAIRWDAWQDDGRVNAEVERTLGPNKWHATRIPFFGQITGTDSVRIRGNSQAIMDREIAYAKQAGLDYWAFVAYDADEGMSNGLELYLASTHKSDIKFCLVTGGDGLGGATSSDLRSRLVPYFKMGNYQDVREGRPLLFLFGPANYVGAGRNFPTWAAAKAALDSLRAESVAAGAGNPYVVVQGWSPSRDRQIMLDLGADAIGSYAVGGGSTDGAPYSSLAGAAQSRWDSQKRTGAKVVPVAASGWDRRPRSEAGGVFWEDAPGSSAYFLAPTGIELANHVKSAIAWVTNNASAAEAATVLVYAWNENDEGGWLTPTLKADGTCDISRIDALRSVLVREPAIAAGADLIGYWPLRGDCRDHSGNGLHGVNHGVRLDDATFDGKSAYIEIPASSKLQLGARDFTLSAWVYTEQDTDDVIGDVLSQYDAARRRGFTLTIKSTAGGYSSHGDDRHVYFGIDNAQDPVWEDCGRPSPTSNYVSNSLTVFDGHLYAAITDAERFEDWCHVFRYGGGHKWEDCGRVGDRRTHGVGPMVVHRGSLYAATWTYDWTRVGIEQPLDDFCCVYRYVGGTRWEDCGQPGQCRRLFGLASYRGGLYVTAEDGRCYVYAGERKWKECGRFPNYAHPLGIHDGKLYAGVLNPAGVWSFDGRQWSALGNPQGAEERCNQVHALEVFRGRLHATTWPEGRVVRLEADGNWTDCGRLGDALEINALTVYNGQLYGGTIPRAEVFRYNPTVEPGTPVQPPSPESQPKRRVRRPAPPPPEPGSAAWTSVRRFLDPAGYEFKDSNEWARVTSLTSFQGKLFASLGSCTSSRLDAPCDFRGTVWSMEAGRCVSYDRDLGPGWHHLTAVRRGDHLELFIDGQLAAMSSAFDPVAYDLTCDSPLRIGYGEVDSFSGKIRDVQLYGRALAVAEVAHLAAQELPGAQASDHAVAGPFQIVRSFPVSEATCAEKVGELYLVAAERSVLVFRKTGPSVADYQEVNRIFPGVDGRIENCAVTEDRLYVPASAQGLLAYRLADLEQPGVQPVTRYQGPRRIGAISAAGRRIYAAYASGGIGVFDAQTLTLLGEGLLEDGLGAMGLQALPCGYVYTTRVPDYQTLLVIDARDPADVQVVHRITNAEYPTMFRFPASIVGSRMYCAEHNGGVGVYDIANPAAPQLMYRHGEVGRVPPRGGRDRPGLVRACAVSKGAAFTAVDRTVRNLQFADDRLQDGGTVMAAELQGNGLLNPTGISLRDGVAAILTTMEGVRFYDVTNPGQPGELLRIDLPSRIEGLAKVGRMVYATADVDGDTLYAALGPAGLAAFDVSDPARPVHLATIAPGTWGNEVVIEPRRKLLSFTGQERFALVDVSDPRRPAVLSNTPVEAGKGTMGSAFSPDGEYLVVCQRGMFSVYDVRDACAPRFLRSYDGCGSENALFFHKWLLVSGRGVGVGVWRVGRTPAELTRVQTLPCYFYNSKFWVEGDRVFTNSEGIDELCVVE